MSDLREDLDATADSVVRDAERLISVERDKQASNGARADRLGEEAVRIADELACKVRVEADLADRLGRRQT